LSSRIVIRVLPAAGLTTGPRFAFGRYAQLYTEATGTWGSREGQAKPPNAAYFAQ